jgi:predicted RNA polymerase sigma factor
MEQRITRAKAKVARADVPFGAPGAASGRSGSGWSRR